MIWRFQIETDNDAFVNSPSREIARILRETADRVDALQDSGICEGPQQVKDLNGNVVGGFDFIRRGQTVNHVHMNPALIRERV